MHKARVKRITRNRLRKYHVDPDYKRDPWLWFNAITFEVTNYGTSLPKRMYLMRRWQKRIIQADLHKDVMELLLDHLSNMLVWKTRNHNKWEAANKPPIM